MNILVILVVSLMLLPILLPIPWYTASYTKGYIIPINHNLYYALFPTQNQLNMVGPEAETVSPEDLAPGWRTC